MSTLGSTVNVKIVEVGPRDGLQNETRVLTIEQRVKLINMLSASGLREIEAGSFVSPKWVPQMQGTTEVLAKIDRVPHVNYPVLIPNLKGLEVALLSADYAPINSIAIFTAASERFCQKNINCSIDESLNRFRDLIPLAIARNIPVRGYLSCITACPYEGRIGSKAVIRVAKALMELGCYEISLGDTIGVARPGEINQLLKDFESEGLSASLALHCHDTYGQALANIYAALERGIRTFDSAVAGLGGCPYAQGSSGNVSTEDVLYLMDGCGMNTGVNLNQVIEAGRYICQELNRNNQSKVANATRGGNP
ncbi:MAG: hydroxymethylglutaryl-CoA lyase [Hahellaceae bacterium]|nr:hydroxymethylglutaryl-CoA lyase [Hahellaceae bacterium]MCP5170416.1 hydroxymethylglutaryl-CoA lyase [Hahellaceae bacterium]